MKHCRLFFVFCTFLVLFPNSAFAYLGPGAGLGAIALTAALAIGAILLIIGFVWYPIKRLFKKKDKQDQVE